MKTEKLTPEHNSKRIRTSNKFGEDILLERPSINLIVEKKGVDESPSAECREMIILEY